MRTYPTIFQQLDDFVFIHGVDGVLLLQLRPVDRFTQDTLHTHGSTSDKEHTWNKHTNTGYYDCSCTSEDNRNKATLTTTSVIQTHLNSWSEYSIICQSDAEIITVSAWMQAGQWWTVLPGWRHWRQWTRTNRESGGSALASWSLPGTPSGQKDTGISRSECALKRVFMLLLTSLTYPPMEMPVIPSGQ